MSRSHPTRWTHDDWRRYGTHAAPESMVDLLATLRREITERQNAADRLATMLAHRQQQVGQGEWPPPRTQTPGGCDVQC